MTQKNINAFVPETSFGRWFLRSDTWKEHVLERAMKDLDRLLAEDTPHFPVVADVGCGYGQSLNKLYKRFSPEKLIAIDVEPDILKAAEKRANIHKLDVEFICCSNADIKLEDNSCDLLFCHQTFHHLIYQQESLNEYLRILKPGGKLFFAESTKRYIHSWLIRYLFRHPMDVQKTAPEYIDLIRNTGFTINDNEISYPFLWWSREDLGLLETLFRIKPAEVREETLVNLIAHKPL